MANNGGAQNSLGQLFVEFGAKGVGNLMKGLNGISAQFLLTKNAAQQALMPILNYSKKASSDLIQLEKTSLATNLPLKRLQEIQQWAKLNNVDYGAYIGEVQKLQQASLKLFAGDAGAARGFQLLGIDPKSVDPSKNPLELMDLVKKSILELYKAGDGATATLGLSYLGMSPEMLWAFTQATKEIDKQLLLTDEQNKKLEVMNSKWNDLNVSVESLGAKLLTTAPIAKGLQFGIDLTKGWISAINDANGSWDKLRANIKATHPVLYAIATLLKFGYKGGKKILDALVKEDQRQMEARMQNQIYDMFNTESQKYMQSTYGILASEPFRANKILEYRRKKQFEKGLVDMPNANTGLINTTANTKSVVYNITNNNQLQRVEDLAQIGLMSRSQAERNQIRNNNGATL